MFLRMSLSASDIRQTNRRWRVGKRKPDENHAGKGNRRRHKERQTPADQDQIPAENYNQAAADGMRDVPYRHAAGKLLGRKPVRQQAGARRKAHALKPAVGHPNQTQRYDRGIKTKEDIHQRRCAQTERHERARIRAIAEKTVREFRNAVKQTVQREEKPQLRFPDAETVLEIRHRHAKVLADEVESRIADDRSDENAFLPEAILASDCGRIL